MSRPEHSYAPQVFYDNTEARKYSTSSRMLNIQKEITNRAIELLNLDQDGPKLLLDVGSGTGLSGQVIADHGHSWIGLDISPSMLQVARENLDEEEARHGQAEDEDMEEEPEDDMEMDENEDEEDDEEDEENEDEDDEIMDDAKVLNNKPMFRGRGDLALHDMGQGLNFRPNSFDGCVSISAVQWLCNAYEKSHVPFKRLRAFFTSLYSILRRGARAVLQLYPETPQQMEMITSAAMAAGFTGGVVVDYPNSAKAKKFYLVLFAGSAVQGQQQQLPRGLGSQEASRSSIAYEKDRIRKGKTRKRDDRNAPAAKSRDWILKKKERQRKQGRDVRPDSKFSGRRRKGKF